MFFKVIKLNVQIRPVFTDPVTIDNFDAIATDALVCNSLSDVIF